MRPDPDDGRHRERGHAQNNTRHTGLEFMECSVRSDFPGLVDKPPEKRSEMGYAKAYKFPLNNVPWSDYYWIPAGSI